MDQTLITSFRFPVNTDAVIKRRPTPEPRTAATMQKKNGTEEWEVGGGNETKKEKGLLNKSLLLTSCKN